MMIKNKIKITIKKLKKIIKNLPDDALVCYHGYDKGCCLNSYDLKEVWFFPKDESIIKALVMNPGNDYDSRKPKNFP